MASIYFTAVYHAKGTMHTTIVPENYSMKGLRRYFAASANIPLKDLQLSRRGKILPHRWMETASSAGIGRGWMILVSSKNDAISGL